MAIGLLTLLKTVPWTVVIASAPDVVDGAKKLWKTVGKKKQQVAAPVETAPLATTPSEMGVRLQTLEARIGELEGEMVASSELITALANQNAELVKRVEANRIRLRWLTIFVTVLVALAAFDHWR